MNDLLDITEFLGRTRRKLRHGEFSRQPFKLLRLEWKESEVDCDWLMRAPDAWDAFVSKSISDQHVSIQALRDALTLREIVFRSFPRIECANLRMFCSAEDGSLELMMTGTMKRSDEILPRVPSIAMRARLCGFRFTLAEGVLKSLKSATFSCI